MAKAKTLNNATAQELAERLIDRLTPESAIEHLAAALHKDAVVFTGNYRAKRTCAASMLTNVAQTIEQLAKE